MSQSLTHPLSPVSFSNPQRTWVLSQFSASTTVRYGVEKTKAKQPLIPATSGQNFAYSSSVSQMTTYIVVLRLHESRLRLGFHLSLHFSTLNFQFEWLLIYCNCVWFRSSNKLVHWIAWILFQFWGYLGVFWEASRRGLFAPLCDEWWLHLFANRRSF